MASSRKCNFNVFINCPFDRGYQKLFKAIVFSVVDCGFTPRCVLELADGSVARLDKLFDLVRECRLGIHDISRTQLDSKNKLPRFNMPLELGIFLGAKRFGSGDQRHKNCIIMDAKKYRYQKFISDLGGKDIEAHDNDVNKVIKAVRNWLGAYSRALIPGAQEISRKYVYFLYQLPEQCRELRLNPRELTFNDYMLLAEEWLDRYDEEIGRN